jgi:hypothetical protein
LSILIAVSDNDQSLEKKETRRKFRKCGSCGGPFSFAEVWGISALSIASQMRPNNGTAPYLILSV